MAYSVENIPAPADRIVADFSEQLQQQLPQLIQGIYVTGSLALNDFYPTKSDIDFVVLCDHLPEKKEASLLNIHRLIAKVYPFPPLSGSYVTIKNFLSTTSEVSITLNFHEGSLRHGKFEMAPVVIAELKSEAITVSGPEAASLNIPLNQHQLKEFLHHNINSYWRNWIDRHSRLSKRKILLILFPRLTEWGILGVARQLYTLHTGKIVSKTEAGLYCLKELPEKYDSIIKLALETRKDTRTIRILRSYTIRPSLQRAKATIELVNFIIERFNLTFDQHPQ